MMGGMRSKTLNNGRAEQGKLDIGVNVRLLSVGRHLVLSVKGCVLRSQDVAMPVTAAGTQRQNVRHFVGI